MAMCLSKILTLSSLLIMAGDDFTIPLPHGPGFACLIWEAPVSMRP
jgi:hypothetical protein